MRFKVDENLPTDLVALLRSSGHDADSVLDEQLGGAMDARIAAACRFEQRVLITLDLDFADLREYPPDDSPGTIVLRLERQDRDSVIAIMRRALDLLKTEAITRRLWIVDESRTRIRGED